MRRISRWHPPTATTIVVFCGLVIHEVAYRLTGGGEYPLEVLANGTRVFVMSHGGLDALGIGLLAITTLLLIDHAIDRTKRRT